MGGRPSKGTPADKRLKENQPMKPTKKMRQAFPGAAPPFHKKGGK